MTVRGIPPISDYAHWNEDAELVWYEENKYDMMCPPEYEDDYYEVGYAADDEYIDSDDCEHQENQSGYHESVFGMEQFVPYVCNDCGMDLACKVRR